MKTGKHTFAGLSFLIIALVCISLPNWRPTSAIIIQDGTRTITADDFTNKRNEASSTSANTTALGGRVPSSTPAKPKAAKRTYKVAATAKSSTGPKPKTATLAQLGITVWRLRPIVRTDTGARMLVREQNKDVELIPERVEADTVFREGDQIRLSIESPQTGFLYVVDRELFSDGTTGPAMLIYPWTNMRGPNNQMRPGKLIDIPAQEDEPAFFTARRSSTRHVGEFLTLIVTTSPLNLPISDKPIEISAADLLKWENNWGGASERLELEGGAGETWTNHEQQASARKGSRQLTREDPPPQTIYRLYSANNQAVLVNLQLRYAK